MGPDRIRSLLAVSVETSRHDVGMTTDDNSRRQQLRAVAQPEPPVELKKHFTKETYQRATAYSISKLRYSLIKTVFDQTYQYYLIKFHIYAAAWDFTGGWMDSIGLSRSRTVSIAIQ